MSEYIGRFDEDLNMGDSGAIPGSDDPWIEPELVVTTTTSYLDEVIYDYSPETLAAYEADGAVAVAVYDDGTEEIVAWSQVFDPTTQAEDIADETDELIAATNQHFWHADDGAHVTDDEQGAWNEEYAKDGHGSLDNPTAAKPWHNILMNSLGILLRTGLRNLVSITRTAVGFFDGRGNGAGNVVASFGREGAVLGHETSLHTEVTDEGFAIKDGAKTLVSIDSDSAQIGASDAEHTVVDSSGMSVYNADGTYAMVNSVDVVQVKEATDQAVADAERAKESAESAEQSASDAGVSASQAAASAQSAQRLASQAADSASSASSAASSAAASAGSAADSAQSASRSAESAATDARSASTDAARANTAANSALVQASIVEDVAGTLDWISKHGTYTPTTDTEVREGTVYFEKQGGDYVPVVQPEGNPSERGWYTLDVTDSQSDYIMAHLAVTAAGLWVLPSGMGNAAGPQTAPGFKLLLAADRMVLYDASGNAVTTYGESISFDSSRAQYIGNEDAYILFTPASGGDRASITIGGGNVLIGTNKKLSDLVSDVAAAKETALDGAHIVVSSTAGLLFKNGSESTVLQAAVFPNGGGRLDTITAVRARFGPGAYIEWRWRHDAEGTWGTLAGDDPHISAGGMWLTVTPSDVDSKTSFEASLVVP